MPNCAFGAERHRHPWCIRRDSILPNWQSSRPPGQQSGPRPVAGEIPWEAPRRRLKRGNYSRLLDPDQVVGKLPPRLTACFPVKVLALPGREVEQDLAGRPQHRPAQFPAPWAAEPGPGRRATSKPDSGPAPRGSLATSALSGKMLESSNSSLICSSSRIRPARWSSSVKRMSGRAIASGIPGSPAPVPTSITSSGRSWRSTGESSGSAAKLSQRCRFQRFCDGRPTDISTGPPGGRPATGQTRAAAHAALARARRLVRLDQPSGRGSLFKQARNRPIHNHEFSRPLGDGPWSSFGAPGACST